MAKYRFQTTPVSRGKGDGAIKRAAYNGRDKLTDERTGKVWDYSKRPGLEASGIFAPENAPRWMRNRQTLWNEVAAIEDKSNRRDTAREARDFKISLPHELTAQQREWLVKDFARYLARKGMVVDWAIHSPDEHSDSRHYHAHILTTTREVTPDGFGKKVREWNKVETLREWREKFAEMGARALDRAGFKLEAERYREAFGTLKEQRKKAFARGDREHAESLDREPTKPMGPQAAAMERRGLKTVRGHENKKTKKRNEDRAKARQADLGVGKTKQAAGRVAGAGMGLIGGLLDAVATGFENAGKSPSKAESRDERLLREDENRDRQRDFGRER